MKLSRLIAELQHVRETQGDIEANLQSNPNDGPGIVSNGTIFVVPEVYDAPPESGAPPETICNIRTWPY